MFDKDKFEYALRVANVTKKELAKVIGINEATLYRKIKSNGNFERNEIELMVQHLRIDNPADIFFA